MSSLRAEEDVRAVPWIERSSSAAIVAGLITLAGLLLRWPSFGDALFGDELSTSYLVSGHGLGEVVNLLQGRSVDLNPPGFLSLAWATGRLGGDSPESLRIGSLVAGTAAIPLTWFLGRRTVGDAAGLVGAALMALSPFLIFFSTEARAYAAVLALTLLASVALVLAVQERRLQWWILYAAASCAAMYVHYPAVFVLFAQFAWAFVAYPSARRPLLVANVAAAVGYLPWLPTLIDNTRSPGVDTIGILNPFGLHTVRVDVGRWALGHQYIPLGSVPGRFALVLIAVGLAVGVAALLSSHGGRALRRPRETWLVVVLACALPAGLALYSSFTTSVWETRNLIASWPGLALAAGALVTAGRGVLRIAAVALVVGGFLIGGLRMLSEGVQRPDYDEIARSIAASAPRGSAVVEVPIPTPGPLAPVADAGFADLAGARARVRFLRLAYPEQEQLLGAKPYTVLPAAPPTAVAARAAYAAMGGPIFLVAPGSAPFSALRDSTKLTAAGAGVADFGAGLSPVLLVAVLGQVERFLAALPGGYEHVGTRTVPGFLPVSVYELRDDRSGDRTPGA